MKTFDDKSDSVAEAVMNVGRILYSYHVHKIFKFGHILWRKI